MYKCDFICKNLKDLFPLPIFDDFHSSIPILSYSSLQYEKNNNIERRLIKESRYLSVIYLQVLTRLDHTTLFQSTCFTFFTGKRLVICKLLVQCSKQGVFQSFCLQKKCSFNIKSYVFSKLCSNMKRFRSENVFCKV